jgi:hypothetical protein
MVKTMASDGKFYFRSLAAAHCIKEKTLDFIYVNQYFLVNRNMLYRMAQESVNWLVKYMLKYVRYFFITYWICKNCPKWDSIYSQHTMLTMPWYYSTNWVSCLCLNIPVNTRECFRLTEFWATLYICKTSIIKKQHHYFNVIYLKWYPGEELLLSLTVCNTVFAGLSSHIISLTSFEFAIMM